VDALRGLGLTALRHIGPLRRLVMREGVAPSLGR
jgi:2-octaprenyl-6-methoxyphenol hydroxylase